MNFEKFVIQINYEQECIPGQNRAYFGGENNTLSEMSLIMDEVGKDHTAQNLPQHKYIKKEIASKVLKYFQVYRYRLKWLYV